MNTILITWNSIITFVLIYLILKQTTWKYNWPSILWSIKDPFRIGIGRKTESSGSWKWHGFSFRSDR